MMSHARPIFAQANTALNSFEPSRQATLGMPFAQFPQSRHGVLRFVRDILQNNAVSFVEGPDDVEEDDFGWLLFNLADFSGDSSAVADISLAVVAITLQRAHEGINPEDWLGPYCAVLSQYLKHARHECMHDLLVLTESKCKGLKYNESPVIFSVNAYCYVYFIRTSRFARHCTNQMCDDRDLFSIASRCVQDVVRDYYLGSHGIDYNNEWGDLVRQMWTTVDVISES